MCLIPPPPTLVFFYNEAIIQLGFIAFFATAFPFAPLFSFLTNLLEIKIKLNHISEYGRRNVAEGTSTIGNWSQIMSFISYFAIPMNVMILLVCRFPGVQVGASQDLDNLLESEESVLVQYLREKDSRFWNRANIILLAILIEHVVIGLKIVIAAIIPDVPRKVVEDEFKRQRIEDAVKKELIELKIEGGHETFADIEEKLQKEAADVMKEQIAKEAENQDNFGEDFVVTKESKRRAK